MQVILVYLKAFRLNSLLKCVLQPKIAKNLLKNLFRDSRSIKVIDVDKIKKPVASACYMISSMSVPICNRFHTEPIPAK